MTLPPQNRRDPMKHLAGLILAVIVAGAFLPVAVQAACTEPGLYYVELSFGEKSGFDEGFDWYGVPGRLSQEGLNLFACDGRRLVGPYGSEGEAAGAAARIEQIALDNGWLHFYSSVVGGAAAPANSPSAAYGRAPAGEATASPVDGFLDKVTHHAGVLLLILVLDVILSVLITRLVLRLIGFSSSLAMTVVIFLVTPLLHHCSHIIPILGFIVSTAGLIVLYGYLFRKTSTGKPVGCVTGLLLVLLRLTIHYVVLIIGLVVFAGQLADDLRSMF